MIGLITGDIVGSPYRQDNVLNEDFQFFDANVRQYYRKKDKDWTEVRSEAQITRNVVPALAVMHWLQYSPELEVSDLVSDLTEYGDIYADLGYGGQDAASLAFLPLGVFAKDEKHLSELQDKVFEAIRECNSQNKGIDRNAVFSISNEDYFMACSASEAVYKVHHGVPKAELRLWASGLFETSLRAGESEVKESSVKEGNIAEHREFNWSISNNNKKDNSLQRSFCAALYSFLYSSNYENGLRKSVSMGGCSPTVAAIYSTFGQVAYGGVTPHISAQAEQFLDRDMHKIVTGFENKFVEYQHYTDSLALPEDERKEEFQRKATSEGESYVKERTHREMSGNTINVICRQGYSPVYLVPEDRKDIKDYLIKKLEVKDIYIQDPSQRDSLMAEFMPESRDETYISGPRPELTTMYFSEGRLLSVSGTKDKAVTTDLDLRKRIRYCFNEFKERILDLNSQIQKELGMTETRYVHFATAAYAEVGKDRVCVYKGVGAEGDNLLAEVGIDAKTGLIRLNKANQGLEYFENGVFDDIHAQLFVPSEAFNATAVDKARLARDYPDPVEYEKHLTALNKARQAELVGKQAIIEEKTYEVEGKERILDERGRVVSESSSKKEITRKKVVQAATSGYEKYYNIQPLQDVYQAIENTVCDISTAQDARMEQERKDRNTGSPYDYEGRKTNLDLMNEDLSNTKDPVLQRETWGGMKI